MRKSLFILLVVILALPLAAKNKAVLIGVSNYPDGSGWRILNAHNDVTLLTEVLSSEWDVYTLEDRDATHNGIISLLRTVAKTVSSSDTVLVHFSGHGQQMLPIEADPLYDPDMLDEAIIPYDAKIKWTSDYTGQNHLRDNEFGVLIDAIRDRAGIGGLVVVILDACHSDSMQREPTGHVDATDIYRGTSDIFGKDVTDNAIRKRFNRDTSRIEINNNASVIYLSACQAHSKNAEIADADGVGYGSLSYAVAGALKNVGIKDLNAFLDCVVEAMDTLVQYQTPGIRASFDYQRPVITKVDTPITPSNNEENSRLITCLIVITTTLALLLVVIWKKRRE